MELNVDTDCVHTDQLVCTHTDQKLCTHADHQVRAHAQVRADAHAVTHIIKDYSHAVTSDGDVKQEKPGKPSEMHKPSSRSIALALTKSEMHCHERSPGGGKVSKIKRGTPRKTVASIRKLFENSSTSEGLVGLRQQHQIKFNLPQREFVTGQKAKIVLTNQGGC